MTYTKHKIELEQNGYSILDSLYSSREINQILECIEQAKQNETSFLKTKDLFADSKEWDLASEFTCEVKKGGAMLMKPLTLHASGRTTNGKQRRVIHLELNKHQLPKPLNWLEYWNENTF